MTLREFRRRWLNRFSVWFLVVIASLWGIGLGMQIESGLLLCASLVVYFGCGVVLCWVDSRWPRTRGGGKNDNTFFT